MAPLKILENLLVMLSLVGLAVSTTCGNVLTIDADGSCQYRIFGAVATADEARSCCGGHLTYLMPRHEQVSDFRFLFTDPTDGPFLTSFTIAGDQLLIDGSPVTENLTDKWRNGQKPTGDVTHIAAEYKGFHDYELYAADRNDPFKALCIRVTQNCSCNEQQECVGQFTNVCEATCQNRTVVDPDPDVPRSNPEDPRPDLLKELLAPILTIAIVIFAVIFVVIKRKTICPRIHPSIT